MNVQPTSPDSDPEIEQVFGDALPQPAGLAPAESLMAEWRRLGAFLKRPTLDAAGTATGPLTVLARIYALDVAVMLALIVAASIAVALGVYIPETALAGIEFTIGVVLLVIVGAPVMEELVFRGWLSGRPSHIVALLSLGAGFLGVGWGHAVNLWLGVALLVAGVVGAGLALTFLNRHPPFALFARFFAIPFWLATLAFALVHIFNFEGGESWTSWLILLPLVLPQFVLGALVGYVRVQIGLWAAIVLHAVHNSTALAIAALAMGGGG